MDRLKTFQIFVAVVEAGSFTGAAETLRISKPAISRAIRDLESWLEATLFRRSTRRIYLTEDGQKHLEKCKRIIASVEELQSSSMMLEKEPTGELRISAPVFFGKHWLGQRIPGFLDKYPKLKISLDLQDRFVDLEEEKFDAAIRISRSGKFRDEQLVSKKLRDMSLVMFASPKYLSSHGTPKSPDDLKHHNCLVDRQAAYGNRWPMDRHAQVRRKVRGNIDVNSGEMIVEFALGDLGIGLLPDFFVDQALNDGRLVSLLADNKQTQFGIYFGGVYLVYPEHLGTSQKLNAFVDYIQERFAEEPLYQS